MCAHSMHAQLTSSQWCCDTHNWGRLCTCGCLYQFIRLSGFHTPIAVSPIDDISSCVGRCVRAGCIQGLAARHRCCAPLTIGHRQGAFKRQKRPSRTQRKRAQRLRRKLHPGRERLLTELGAIM